MSQPRQVLRISCPKVETEREKLERLLLGETSEKIDPPTSSTPIFTTSAIDDTDGWEEIRMGIEPKTTRFLLPSMYKLNSRNVYSVWRIGFEAKTTTEGVLEMRYGIVDGAITVDHTRVEVNNSGRNIIEQGSLEARKRYLDKWHEGYRTADDFGTTAVQGVSGVMKANIWKDKTKKNNLKKGCIIDWVANPYVLVQPKLDGIRVVCRLLENGTVQGRSKENKVRWTTDHIYQELAGFMMYLPNGTELDGELYCHDMTFSTLTSVANTGNRETDTHRHPRIKELKYYVFDLIDPGQTMPQEDRYNLLVSSYNKYIEDSGNTSTRSFCPLPAVLVRSDNEIQAHHDMYVKNGYEGVMIRRLALGSTSGKQYADACYQRKRCYGLLKYKEFFDEEALVLSVDGETGKGTEEGLALLTIQDRRGNILPSVRSRGTFETRRQWVQHPESIVGKVVTFRFQERSEYGVPRFPVVIGPRVD